MQLRSLLDKFYFTITVIQPILITHLFIILMSKFLITPENLNFHNSLLYSFLPASIPFLTYIIFQLFRVNAFDSKFKQEEWLPIVNDQGVITGKIARSISSKMKNRFMHPVVRVALICNNQLYLQKRDAKRLVDPEKYDYPFEKYVKYNHQVNIAVRNSVAQYLGYEQELSSEFLLKYTFKNENTNRFIFLYVVQIDNEDIIPKKNKLDGKFWSAKQIENTLSDGIFSESFELEFEYIKNTFLLPKENQNMFLNNRQNA